MFNLIRKVLEVYGNISVHEVEGVVLLIFKCAVCGKIISASSPFELYVNSSRHLRKHGVDLWREESREKTS